MNWATQQRLRFIDLLLDHYGKLNRATLTDYFGISQPQASNDIKRYLVVAPSNARYDTTAKTYLRTSNFKRMWK